VEWLYHELVMIEGNSNGLSSVLFPCAVHPFDHFLEVAIVRIGTYA